MRERIDFFANQMCEKTHISQLVEKLSICLRIEVESGIYYLSFYEGKAERLSDNVYSQFQMTLRGSEEFLNQLFDGEYKLREGIKRGYITIENGPFRDLLVLESIFYLLRPLTV